MTMDSDKHVLIIVYQCHALPVRAKGYAAPGVRLNLLFLNRAIRNKRPAVAVDVAHIIDCAPMVSYFPRAQGPLVSGSCRKRPTVMTTGMRLLSSMRSAVSVRRSAAATFENCIKLADRTETRSLCDLIDFYVVAGQQALRVPDAVLRHILPEGYAAGATEQCHCIRHVQIGGERNVGSFKRLVVMSGNIPHHAGDLVEFSRSAVPIVMPRSVASRFMVRFDQFITVRRRAHVEGQPAQSRFNLKQNNAQMFRRALFVEFAPSLERGGVRWRIFLLRIE